MRSQNLSLASFAMAIVCLALVGALLLGVRIQEMSGAEAVYEYLVRHERQSFSEAQMKKVSAGVRWSHERYSDIQNSERLLLWYSAGLVAMSAYFLSMSVYFRRKEPNQTREATTVAVTPRAPSSTDRASHGRGAS
jgi:hypothetical protein